MQSIEFYQAHLDRVSRSFAFCIRTLDAPMRPWVSLSYLMCRVLDTIEDSIWTDLKARDAVYAEFEAFMAALPATNAVQLWAKKFPETIPEREELLLGDAHLLFKDLHALPAGAKASIQQTVMAMYRGMRHYANDSGSSLKLKDLVDVNRYCYFVAGVVGELLSRLILEARKDFKPGPEFMKNAFHFGLFLQKVNLLKDQRGDEREGRYLVPDREVLMASLRENAIGAVEYIAALPVDERGYRTFCAWSLFLGAASLPFIQQAYEADDGSKIPRSVTEDLLKAVAEIAQNNTELREALAEYLPQLPRMPATAKLTSSDDGAWFARISGDVLQPSELAELRLR
ncbi:MAG: squalene/phytoene synthase family protein [Oligoflexia bacterium]|nr:squalene/phytoene synthase family protein [Oligoflexia bacterium]